MVMLNEVVDTSIDEELLLDYDDDGEIHLLAAIGAFMRRDLNRIVGFYEIVVPSYSVDEFRSHFRMTKNTFEVLSRELAATGAIPTGETALGENQFHYRSRLWRFFGTHRTWK